MSGSITNAHESISWFAAPTIMIVEYVLSNRQVEGFADSPLFTVLPRYRPNSDASPRNQFSSALERIMGGGRWRHGRERTECASWRTKSL